MPLPGDSSAEIETDISAVQRLESLPTILEVLCELTGMRFAAVARVTEGTWTACAIRDALDFGLAIGGQLPVNTTLCIESKHLNEAIAISNVSTDPRYSNHPTPRTYQFESYVSVPIVLESGRYFGNLCAIDPAPADVNNPKVIGIFKRFASLIATTLDGQEKRDRDRAALAHERTTSELREQFIAVLGHDLRNPLQASFASSEMLMKKPNDPALVQQLAGRIKANLKRMSLLIDDVLDFARAKLGGGIDVEISDAKDVNSALEQIVRELQDGHPNRQILANINVTQKVHCDLSRVQQVTSNLIGNALTHGAPNTPVRVTAHNDEQFFVFEVWNGGTPISPDSVPKIFEPFWRSSTSPARQGLGLGLHICSQIVRAHNGKLAVSSSVADGTTFTMSLPLRQVAEAE